MEMVQKVTRGWTIRRNSVDEGKLLSAEQVFLFLSVKRINTMGTKWFQRGLAFPFFFSLENGITSPFCIWKTHRPETFSFIPSMFFSLFFKKKISPTLWNKIPICGLLPPPCSRALSAPQYPDRWGSWWPSLGAVRVTASLGRWPPSLLFYLVPPNEEEDPVSLEQNCFQPFGRPWNDTCTPLRNPLFAMARPDCKKSL